MEQAFLFGIPRFQFNTKYSPLATVSGLTADKPTIVRISAVRAIWGFSQYLRASKNRTLLTPFLPAVTDALINMCGAFNSSTEVLGLILQNLSLVLAVIEFFANK